MDELELISRLREEVPLASADRAEHAFLTSVQGRGTWPVRRHGLVRLLRLRTEAAVPLAAAAAIRRRRPAGIIIAAATAAGLAAAGLTLLPGSSSLPGNTSLPRNTSLPGNTSGASPAAARLLAKVAAAAAAQPNPPVRDSQFVYLKTWGAGSVCTGRPLANSDSARVAVPGDCVPEKPDEVQFWYPVSSLCATGAFLKDGKMTKFSFKAASVDPEQFPCSGNMNYPTYRFLQTLPTDPHALLRLIQHTDGHPGLYWWAFSTIGNLLYNGSPPPVTAALYRAAALIPGVTVVPDATDTIGRPGVAVAFIFQGIRTEWIFSKQTLQYLGSREINIANGALVSQTAIQQRAIVDHAGQAPG
ncbi:MAG: CU044_5270 family protein [Trebonia sp.]